MNETAEKLNEKQYPPLVDPVTGEIIEGEDAFNIAKLGWVMSQIAKNADHMTNPKHDCNCKFCFAVRQYEFCTRHIEKLNQELENSRSQVMALARKCFPLDVKSMKIPGSGTFRYQKGRESVDTSEFEAMAEDERMKLINTYGRSGGVYFVHKIPNPVDRYRPDKKAIKERLKSDMEPIPGFKLIQPDDEFKFVPEK